MQLLFGFDIGENDRIKVTFQFTMPNASGEGSTGQIAPIIVDSSESACIESAVNLMNTFVSKEINLAHCKIIVFSEEFAKQGISKEIYSLVNKVQVRPNANIIICTSTAEEYIRSVKPSLENLVAKFYEILPRSSEYTGFTSDIKLEDFFHKLESKSEDPIAILGSPVSSNSGESSQNSSGSSSGGGTSGDSSSSQEGPLPANNGIENIGLAVFKKDKLVGTLTTTETLCNLIITKKLKSCRLSIPDPEDENKAIDMYLTAETSPQIKVRIINGTPYVSVKVKMNSRIASINQISEQITEERIAKIEESASYYLKTHLLNYLYKTSKSFNSDISGIGNYALNQFKTCSDFENYNWLDNFENTFFHVDTDVSIRSNFLLVGT